MTETVLLLSFNSVTQRNVLYIRNSNRLIDIELINILFIYKNLFVILICNYIYSSM
jgi:hypothetical protein